MPMLAFSVHTRVPDGTARQLAEAGVETAGQIHELNLSGKRIAAVGDALKPVAARAHAPSLPHRSSLGRWLGSAST
jgi:hypothetical protein